MGKARTAARIQLADPNRLLGGIPQKRFEKQAAFPAIAKTRNHDQALFLAEINKSNALILDDKIKNRDTLEALKNKLKALLFVADNKKNKATGIFKKGARGIILKKSAADSLYSCISAAAEDQDRSLNKKALGLPTLRRKTPLLSAVQISSAKFDLTRREMQVLAFAAAGWTDIEIAGQLSIRKQTVKRYMIAIFKKLGVCNRLELALFAFHNGLVADGVN